MIVVSDTSPLCNLALVNHLWLLEAIYQTVIIPTLVAEELAAANNPAIPAILQLDWIQTRSPTNATIANQLQTQHPHVTTETEALAIIDAEFTEIKQSPTNKLVTLRKQLLNPERHAQAIKATLGEIAKHYLEESVWAKATLTYLDKLSETPDQGA